MTKEEKELIAYGVSSIQRMNDIRVAQNKEPLSPYTAEDPSGTMSVMLKDYIPTIEGFEQGRAKKILGVFENPDTKTVIDETFRTFAGPTKQLSIKDNRYSIDYSK